LIAEKQGFLVSVSESGGGELLNEEEVLECKTCKRDMPAELGDVVTWRSCRFLDDAVKT
jgi:hypothetical protein